jgi:hypothetical protein
VRKLPLIAFGALVAASVAAIFVTQHLKVTTPLIADDPFPAPAAISRGGIGCGHRELRIGFYLLHRADVVDVYVIDQTGAIVATLGSDRQMGIRDKQWFYWNGKEDNGSSAPDGTYYIRIALRQQGRIDDLHTKPITVTTVAPRPVVTSVSAVAGGTSGGSSAAGQTVASGPIIPQNGDSRVTIRFTGNEHRDATVRIYRTDLPGPPQLVKQFVTLPKGEAVWDGLINHRPAPAGTYLVGLDVTDKACNTGHFPPILPPLPGSTAHAGVTVRYIAALPPPDPVAAGSRATVQVDSRQRPYRWALTRVGAPRKTLAGGSASSVALNVRLKAKGLYKLTLSRGPYSTTVPLVARASRGAPILVVLPALTWQGSNPVDGDGDGIPDTLDNSSQVGLARPFATGLPAGFNEAAGLLAYLDRAHLPYDVTTDLAMSDGAGPGIGRHRAIVFAGSERWLPSSLVPALTAYLKRGGRIVSIGIDSLRRTATVSGLAASTPQALPGQADLLGAVHGPLVSHDALQVLQLRDDLGIFSGTAGALPGFTAFEPITAPGQAASSAGTNNTSAAIAGYRLGSGFVVEIGLAGFGATLPQKVNSEEFLNRLWTVIGG